MVDLRVLCGWRRAVACLAAGLVLQTAVVWAFTLFGDRPWHSTWASLVRTSQGWEAVGASDEPTDVGGEALNELIDALPRSPAAGFLVGQMTEDAYCRVSLEFARGPAATFRVLSCYSSDENIDGKLDVHAGWPFRSLSCAYADSQFLSSYRAGADRESVVRGLWSGAFEALVTVPNRRSWERSLGCGLSMPRPDDPMVELRPMPYRPILAGLAGNTALFGGAAWLLTSAPMAYAASRQASMRRAGVCVRCRYLVGNLPRCPECGTPVTPASLPPSCAASS